MKKEYVFFDIDRVLFDTEKYVKTIKGILKNYCKERSVEEVHIKAYSKTFETLGNFNSDIYSSFIFEFTGNADLKKKLRLFFENDENYSSCLFSDVAKTVRFFSEKYSLGVLSWGDRSFQERKIFNQQIGKYINIKDIYIFPDFESKVSSIKNMSKRYCVKSSIDDDKRVVEEWGKYIKYPVLKQVDLRDKDDNFEYRVGSLREFKKLPFFE